MDSSGLELFTSQELISELMQRKTFLGVVVHSKEDFKNEKWNEEQTFRVHFNSNLDSPQACRLLDRVAAYMERNIS